MSRPIKASSGFAGLRLALGEHERHQAAKSFAFSLIVLQVFGSNRVASFLHAAHGDDPTSNAALLALCWVTAQILERSLSLAAYSCSMLGEEIAGMLSPRGNEAGQTEALERHNHGPLQLLGEAGSGHSIGHLHLSRHLFIKS